VNHSVNRIAVYNCEGVAVRMAARRPNGKVLVEYLNPKTHAPQQQWRECWPHQLRGSGLTMAHIKALIVVLPLARLAGDDDGKVIEAAPQGAAESEQQLQWWQRD
jgi:hypothetical protein